MYKIEDIKDTIIKGDAIAILKQLPNEGADKKGIRGIILE
jgi:DNA modification methylase